MIKDYKKENKILFKILWEGRTLIALFILVAVFGIKVPNFLTVENMLTITKHVAEYALLGIGMTFIILTGGIDLSVGSIVGFAAMMAGGFIYEGIVLQKFGITIFLSIPIVIILTLIISALVGTLNGLIISYVRIPPFIATLGTMYVLRGFALLRSNGMTFPNLQGKPEYGNTGFEWLGQGFISGIPVAVIIFIIVAIIAAYILSKTPFGWHVYAVGGNEKAAELSGLKVKKIKILCYTISGFCAGLVGLIVASELVASHPAIGEGWEMNAIAAAVLGGASLSGGIGSIGGTVIGAFIIGVLNDGMVMMGVSEFWQKVVKGIVIVLAVGLDILQQEIRKRQITKPIPDGK
jgi:ribose/xylose/arabinose/galactoside ABC-type transport system permease subunit